MLFIWKGLPLGEQPGDSAYIAAWRELLEENEKDTHALQRALFSHMYENLNILDAKAHSLIQLTGILVAAYVVVPTLMFASADTDHMHDPLLAIFLIELRHAAAAIYLLSSGDLGPLVIDR